jgi:RNA polymerase sigma-70 factor, ECF subfamily
MTAIKNTYSASPEALIVGLARTGDAVAFEELVLRRQAWIRNLMRRFCGDETQADDLAQQVFLQAWRDISKLRQPNKFAGWLKRLAVNVWYQHLRKHDALSGSVDLDDTNNAKATESATDLGMDLDQALTTLAPQVRLCVVLAYHEGMSHGEIAALAALPIGTVKSHIRRGSQHLQQLLAVYADETKSNKMPGDQT